jgi:hypothetical protein
MFLRNEANPPKSSGSQCSGWVLMNIESAVKACAEGANENIPGLD